MKIEELLPGIGLENKKTEFKLRLSSGIGEQKGDEMASYWIKEIVAFANTEGGDIYVGVNDKTHELSPLSASEFDKTANLVYSEIKSRVEPPIDVTISEIPVKGSSPTSYIMKISVPFDQNTPVMMRVNGMPVAFVRRFGRTEAATSEELRNLFLRGDGISYDDLPTKTKGNLGVFSDYADEYEKANGQKLTKKILISLKMITEDGFLTRGGYLFSDLCKSQSALMTMTYWKGESKGGDAVYSDVPFDGPLHQGVRKAVKFVKDHSVDGYVKTPNSRKDYFSYPERSVFEGIVNAYAHRNYLVNGSQISLDIFIDRLEITSPGSLSGSSSYKRNKDIASIHPKRRNQVICDAFRAIRFMEEKGSGFEKIALDYEGADEKHLPFVDSTSEFFRLTLPDLSYEYGVIDEECENPEIEFLEGSVVNHDKEILSYCYAGERSLTEIASFLNMVPSSYLRKEILGPLCEKGFLHQRNEGGRFSYRSNRSLVHLKERLH